MNRWLIWVVLAVVAASAAFIAMRMSDRTATAPGPMPGARPDSGAAARARAGVQEPCIVEESVALPDELRETSGIARAADGSLWTHNDGNEARLYRVSESGAVEQRIAIDGAGATDVEDIDAAPCPDGTGECLWLADIGDNDARRADVALLVVAVPAAGAERARASRIGLRYPSGPRDAEALAALPSGGALIFSKGRDAPIELFRVATHDTAGADRVAERVAGLAAEPSSSRRRVTGAGATPDGSHIAVRTSEELRIHRTDRLVAGDTAPALRFDLRPLRESQGEGVDIAADGRVWLTSEGERGTPTLARLRCVLPE